MRGEKKMISNCGKSETGGCYGEPGDQTRQEYWNIAWWNNGWCAVFRHPSISIRSLIAEYARNAADNDNIGYSWDGRTTMWQQMSFMNGSHDPKKITTRCNADCSASTMAIIKAVGLDKNEPKLSSIPIDWATPSMLQSLESYGFKKLTDAKYLTSDRYLLTGDILMSEGHACIVITDGSEAGTEEKDADIELPVPEEYSGIEIVEAPAAEPDVVVDLELWDKAISYMPDLYSGYGMNDPKDEVKAWQAALNKIMKSGLEVDGEFGSMTEAATKEFITIYGDNENE